MGGSLLHDNTRVQNEVAPFFSSAQLDTVEEVACKVCAAPLRVYEVKQHELSCRAIEKIRPNGGQVQPSVQGSLP